MMKFVKTIVLLVIILGLGSIAWKIVQRLQAETVTETEKEKITRPAPVEIAAIETGNIARIRSFTGTLKANEEFLVAPKLSGRIVEISVDLADFIERGQVVARMNNDEYRQALAQAEADLAVARANLAEARSLLEITRRELQRVETLRERGVSSEAEQDAVIASNLARTAHVEVTRAQILRAESAVETARIRLEYSNITATWQGGNDQRIVAERFIDEGETVNVNEPLLRIVELDPLIAEFFVTERDYAQLNVGLQVRLNTDAYPDESFTAEILRIAPVFNEASRQAAVELQVANPDRRLKPGMFVRADVTLEQVEAASLIPESALVTRQGQPGVFLVTEDKTKVRWQPVTVGIQQGSLIQIVSPSLTGDVVTLGQQLLDDNAPILLPTSTRE